MCRDNQENFSRIGGIDMAIEDRLEVERIQNLVRNFGWELVKQESSPDALVITLSKKRVVEDNKEGPG